MCIEDRADGLEHSASKQEETVDFFPSSAMNDYFQSMIKHRCAFDICLNEVFSSKLFSAELEVLSSIFLNLVLFRSYIRNCMFRSCSTCSLIG